MGVVGIREWSCDNLCGRIERHPLSETAPDGWVQLRWNSRAPMGSMDADGWESAVLCVVCWSGVEDALDNIVNPEPENVEGPT